MTAPMAAVVLLAVAVLVGIIASQEHDLAEVEDDLRDVLADNDGLRHGVRCELDKAFREVER